MDRVGMVAPGLLASGTLRLESRDVWSEGDQGDEEEFGQPINSKRTPGGKFNWMKMASAF